MNRTMNWRTAAAQAATAKYPNATIQPVETDSDGV